MQTYLNYTLLVFLTFALLNCGRYLVIDRTQFLKDGDVIPTIDLNGINPFKRRPSQDPFTAVAMAISGGGSRASNFGIGIMLGLEEIKNLGKAECFGRSRLYFHGFWRRFCRRSLYIGLV